MSTCRKISEGFTSDIPRGFSCSRACCRYTQSLGQSSVTSRCSPQHCGQMRPCTAGQKRFSFRIPQMTQLTADSFKHYDTHDEVAGSTDRRQKTPCAPERLFCGWAVATLPLGYSGSDVGSRGSSPRTCLEGPFWDW